MALVEWKQEYETGQDTIDNQHRYLVELLNALYTQILKELSADAVMEYFNKMQEYALIHFTDEEELMEKVNYPYLKSHRSAHREFIHKLREFIPKLRSGKKVVGVEMTVFLKNWLLNHIAEVDMRYKDFLVQD